MPSFIITQPTRYCQELCCSGFCRTEIVSQNLAAFPRLSNSIHTFFARERFPSDIDYDAIKPSLRLATHLIEASLPFWHSVTHANPRACGTVSAGGPNYELTNTAPPLTDAEKISTRDGLRDLAPFMLYKIPPPPVNGVTGPGFSETTLGDARPNGGYFMDITIQRNIYTNCVFVHDNVKDLVSTHWVYFKLALNLVHELAHACTTTVLHTMHYPPAMWPNLFFGTGLVAEEGFEWEAHMFGGIVGIDQLGVSGTLSSHLDRDGEYPYWLPPSDSGDGDWAGQTSMISMVDWPNNGETRKYGSRGWGLGSRGELPATYVRWNVDFENIHRLFQDEFWANPILPGALHFPKRIGFRFYGSMATGREGDHTPLPPMRDDGSLDTTSGIPEGGYRVHYHPWNGGHGLVLAPGVEHPFGPDGFVFT